MAPTHRPGLGTVPCAWRVSGEPLGAWRLGAQGPALPPVQGPRAAHRRVVCARWVCVVAHGRGQAVPTSFRAQERLLSAMPLPSGTSGFFSGPIPLRQQEHTAVEAVGTGVHPEPTWGWASLSGWRVREAGLGAEGPELGGRPWVGNSSPFWSWLAVASTGDGRGGAWGSI